MIKQFVIRFAVFVCCWAAMVSLAVAQSLWTAGPMVHYRFGSKDRHFSYGFEVAYWNLRRFPYSLDAGVELAAKHVVLYGELQTGFGLAGLSLGPVVVYNRELKKLQAGFQSTIWANFFLGADYRFRQCGGERNHYAGAYLKLPFAMKDISENSQEDFDTWD